ncbi:hypothetical protein AX769_11715 [Frondihabitans sp. PAMC 28766]|nr:hypothetical protein AX769_11715 [Frondihabitans sp. PAMC 28766]
MNIAFWLFMLTALVHVVSLIVSAATYNSNTSSVKGQLTKHGSGVSSSQADAFLGAGLVTSIVIGILFIVALVLFAVFMRRGANWARIVLLILTILSLTGVAGLYGLGALGVVAGVVATILMFLRPSSEYFRARKAAKLGQAPGAYPPPAA